MGFSYELSNESIDCYSLNDDEIISLDSVDVYFDSNVPNDGDGSENNPYKYLNSTSLGNCGVAHLKSGLYNYNSGMLNISNDLSFVGESPDNTVIMNIKVNNGLESNNLTFVNVNLINPHIDSFGILDVKNCIFKDGSNSNIVSKKSINSAVNPQIYIKNSEFHDFSSYKGFFNIENTVVTIFNSSFYNNYAYYGGAVYSFSSNLTVINSSFNNNRAKYYGGLVYSFNSNLTFINSDFYKNHAVIGGGVLYDSGWSNVNIIDSNFDLNYVEGYGGVIAGYENSKINIDYSTFLNNNATKEGGVIYVNESLMDINNSLFFNSSASFGGAICNLKSKTNIKNTTFNNNGVIYEGGAIYNMYSTLNLTQIIFNNNNPSGLFFDNSTVNIQYSNFIQTDIKSSYYNDFNIDNSSNYGDRSYSNLSLNRINSAPVYYGNYVDVDVSNLHYYDGRDDNLNTSVKNQYDGGNCWAFASLATLESCILKTNNQSVFDLSEANMKNVIARFSDYGLNINTNGGGNPFLAMGYLSSWFGPVLDNEDVYCPTNSLSPILDNCIRIQNMYILPKDNLTSIKEAVYKYGSVYYRFLCNDSRLEWGTYNYDGTNTNISGHAVSIIGWDDNFSRDNFECKPKDNGAWIAKNSWGIRNQDDDGYIYISYENNNNIINHTAFFTFILNDTNDYDYNYQYDIYCDDYPWDSSSLYISNNFTSSRYELLSAVSTYFLTKNINYTITVKINDNIVHSQSGFMKNKGYYTIPLTNTSLILNENDTFEIIFYLYSNEGVIHIPLCFDNSITHILHPGNSSRYSDDGVNWSTFDDGVFCIKAFASERYHLIAEDVTKYFHDPERFYVTLIDGFNQSVENKTIFIEINGVTYNRITDANGTASMALGLNSGVYNATVTFENKRVISLVTILPTVNGTDVVKMFRNGTQYCATFRDTNGVYLDEGTTVKFNINGVIYNRNVSGNEGLAKLNINLEPGEYIITAINPVTGEDAANNVTVLSLLTENKDLTKYYRNASQYSVKVLGADGHPVGANVTVKFNINGVFYERTTNESGIAKLNINLKPEDYIITAEYNGCRVSNNITVLPVLSAEDITMKYRDGTQFKVKLVDGQGNPYVGQTVEFNIHGVFYNRVTGSDGIAKLNINLMPGEYIITSSYNGSNIANTITITS